MESMTEPNFLSIAEARQCMQDGSISPQALRQACYRQIERLNPRLKAFITVCDDVITGSDKRAAAHRPQHTAMLDHIPIAVKDLFETKGIRTTAGSLFFKDHIPDEDALAVQKIKSAGAVIIGKTNTHEIALGVTTDNPHFGTCRNPWDTRRVPGGSSGGSAVAVATGMSLAALGTDTGGSIRIPASLCGVVGLKPTYGRVSLRGVFPLSWNLDHAGPLAGTVKDAAYMLQTLAGYDAHDPGSVNMPVDDYLSDISKGIKGLHAALAAGQYIEDIDAQVLSTVKQAVETIKQLGMDVQEVEMNWLREAAMANGVMTPADGAAYHRERLAERPEWFGADVRQRLEMGRAFTSTEYSLARRTQAEMRRRMELVFAQYELLILPTTPTPAPLIEGNDAVEQARRLTRFTAPFNLTGLPAISIPCGFSSEGLPVGLQIVGPAWNEARILRAAHAYEQQTDWRNRRSAALEAG